MSIPLLKQTHEELRRLSIAGSSVAPGDFRLKKLVPGLEQAGKQSPVFAKLAQGVTKLVESDERSSAAALLDVSTLLNAVLYTQGETDVPGQPTPIESIDLGTQQTRNSARVLKPLLEALTTTGSGRVETVKDAVERNLFHDLRLVGPALRAIDDPYPEIGELIADRVLPLYGRAIIGDLRERFEVKGRAGHVRRLLLLNKLDPSGTRDLVKQSLDEGSKEMKVAAIACLGDEAEDLAFLLEQAKAKAADVRTAALKALGKSTSKEAVAALKTAFLGSDLKLAVEPVRSSKSPLVVAFAVDEAKSQWAGLFKEKDKAKLGKLVERMLLLLECLRRRREDKAIDSLLFEFFAAREKLSTLKSEPSGKDVALRLISVMAVGSDKVQAALIAAHAELDADELADAFLAALRSRKPDEVFKLFSPYLTAKSDAKKKGDGSGPKRDAVVRVLNEGWRWHHTLGMNVGEWEAPLTAELDPRWLDVAVEADLFPLIQLLARPNHAGAAKRLKAEFDTRFAKTKDTHEVGDILRTLIHIGHPDAPQAVVATIEKHSKATSAYYVSWIIRMIPDLPKSALPLIEPLQTKLPEKMVDELLDALAEWKQRP